MAKQEHIELLQRGIDTWNPWRAEHRNVIIDLSEANLSGANLVGADLNGADLRGDDLERSGLIRADFKPVNVIIGVNLRGANLRGADLERSDLVVADLRRADLSGARLSVATLIGARLNGANLSGADLIEANLYDADLYDANLSEAMLIRANLIGANLIGADLSRAITRDTQFDDIDLRGVKGLETIQHQGPSSIDTRTFERSEGDIPDVFLRGVGLSDTFIEYVHALVSQPIQYYTCFISYSSKDQEFAERLYADLQNQGIRCWYAPHSMRPGTVIRREIDQAIRTYDKLLLVLSLNSVESTWVEFEVEAALDKEKVRHQEVLFPIRLDDTVLTTTQAWAAGIRRQRHIGDFTAWKNHDMYRHVFDRLVRDLRTSTANPKT